MNQSTEPYENFCKWSTEKPLAEKGFIVAADTTQEWLLPWWWENYTKYNDLPVAFVDLGLSKEMKNWCKERGRYIHLFVPDAFLLEKASFPKEHIDHWETLHGKKFWESRNAWFKKPLACLQSPFEKNVWMDLDCEVKGYLGDIFSVPLPSYSVAAAKEHLPNKDPSINSGVILFQKNTPLIETWAEESLKNNSLYFGDQDSLYALILKNHPPMADLPLTYNWSRLNQNNEDALVVHWHGNTGKMVISHQIQKMMMQKEGLLS
ncbi:MAG: hypothetical protein V4489_06170 [Chlamydiota bacterium]